MLRSCLRDLYSNIKIYFNRKKYYVKRDEIDLNNIKVLFVVQRTESFSSVETIYLSMVQNNHFLVDVLAIPEHRIKGEKIEFDNESLEYTYKFCCNLSGAHRTFKTTGISLDGLLNIETKYDYVIITIPYENQYPELLKFNFLKQLGRLCYFPYGYNTSNKEFLFMATHPNSLLYNVDYYFVTNSKYYKKILRKKMYISNYLSFSKVLLDKGYPRFDNCKRKCSSKKFTLLWLPRWTTPSDEENEQSTFIEYKDKIIEFANRNPDIDVILRPHPLMFENFINKGLIAKEEVNNYINKINSIDNMHLDQSSSYIETINQADVVISDFTGLLVELFVLEKIVIYTGNINDFSEEFKNMAISFYNCVSFKEIEKTVYEIKMGKDSKYIYRKKAIRNFWSFNKKNPTECVMNFFENNKL